jgi:hypothetical protein
MILRFNDAESVQLQMALTRMLISKVPADPDDQLSRRPWMVAWNGCLQVHAASEAIPDRIALRKRDRRL